MKTLSVLIVGKKGILTWQEDLRDAFERLGCRCTIFYVNPGSLTEWFQKKRLGAIPFQSDVFKGRFQKMVQDVEPKLILFLGMVALPKHFMAFIDSITPEDTTIAGWMPDCVDRIPYTDYDLFDVLFYFDTYMRKFLAEVYKDLNKTVHLPLAVNEHRYFRQKRRRKDRLLFAGSYSADRLDLLNTSGEKIPLDIYGPGFGKFFGIRFGLRLSSEKLNSLFNSYVACLNINQKPNTMNGLNLRPFEATAAGSLVFNENVPDLAQSFEPDKEVLVYRSSDELIDKYTAIMKDETRINKIAEAGYRRTLSEHTYIHRAKFMITSLGL